MLLQMGCQIRFTETFNVFRLLKGFTLRQYEKVPAIYNFILQKFAFKKHANICYPRRIYKACLIKQTSTESNFKSLDPSQTVVKPFKSLKILKVSVKRIMDISHCNAKVLLVLTIKSLIQKNESVNTEQLLSLTFTLDYSKS